RVDDIGRQERIRQPRAEDLRRSGRLEQVRVLGERAAWLVARDAVQNTEQGEQERRLQQDRQTGGERVGARVLVELHHLLLETLTVALVPLLQLTQLRLQNLHLALRPYLPHEQRDQQRADDDDQSDDGQRPVHTVEIGRAHV